MHSHAAAQISEIVEILVLLEATRAVSAGASNAYSRHIPVLRALKAAGRRGLSQVQLAAAIGVAPARMSRLIDRLEPEGVVGRHTHPHDRRSKVIQLTDLGQQRLMEFEADTRVWRDQAFGRLSPHDIRSLKDVLTRLVSTSGAAGQARLH